MKVWIRTPFAFTALIGALAVGACGDDEDPADPGNEPPDEVTVQMDDNVFQPPEVEVAAGGTVTWVNDSGGPPHTATAEDDSWDSGTVAAGGSYVRTFSTPDTFEYVCTIHEDMTGRVVVK